METGPPEEMWGSFRRFPGENLDGFHFLPCPPGSSSMPVPGSVLESHASEGDSSLRIAPWDHKPSLASPSCGTATSSLAPLCRQWLGLASAHQSLPDTQGQVCPRQWKLCRTSLTPSACLAGHSPIACGRTTGHLACRSVMSAPPLLQPVCQVSLAWAAPADPDFDTIPRAAVALQLCFMVALECFHLPPSAQRPLECWERALP